MCMCAQRYREDDNSIMLNFFPISATAHVDLELAINFEMSHEFMFFSGNLREHNRS